MGFPTGVQCSCPSLWGWRRTNSPCGLLPFHLLSIDGQKLVQLCEELRGCRAVIFLSEDEADAFGSGGDCRGENTAVNGLRDDQGRAAPLLPLLPKAIQLFLQAVFSIWHPSRCGRRGASEGTSISLSPLPCLSLNFLKVQAGSKVQENSPLPTVLNYVTAICSPCKKSAIKLKTNMLYGACPRTFRTLISWDPSPPFLYDVKPVSAKLFWGLLGQHPMAGFPLPATKAGAPIGLQGRLEPPQTYCWKTQEYLTERFSHLYMKNATQCI